MNEITVIFCEQLIKDKLKSRGFRETHENIFIVEDKIRKIIDESQLVTWFIQKAITDNRDKLAKALEE
jgi:hypothetical protein